MADSNKYRFMQGSFDLGEAYRVFQSFAETKRSVASHRQQQDSDNRHIAIYTLHAPAFRRLASSHAEHIGHVVIGYKDTYFVRDHSDAPQKYSDADIIKMMEYLIDNIFVEFGGRIFQQTISIPMGTYCAPLLADLFLYSYETEFVQSLLQAGKKHLAQQLNFTYRYRDDVLSLKNTKFAEYLEFIYPRELEIKEITETVASSSYLDCYLYIDNGSLTTRLYGKRDDFNFPIVNFPFLSSNIPSAPAYGVHVLQLIRYARACSNNQDFMSQGYQKTKLVATLQKLRSSMRDIMIWSIPTM